MKPHECLLSLSVACAVAGNAAQAGVTNYWQFGASNLAGGSTTTFSPLVGGITATYQSAGVAQNASFTPGPDGTADAAGVVTNAAGFKTSLVTAGQGTAGSPFSLEFMMKYTASPSGNWMYLTARNFGGFPGPVGIEKYQKSGASSWYVAVNGVAFAPQPTYVLTGNSWYHFAVTYDGADAKFYVTPYSATATANLVQTWNAGGALAATSSVPFCFGIDDGYPYGVAGAFNWAAVWDTALSAADITQHIQNNAVPTPEPGAGILAAAALGVGCVLRRRLSLHGLNIST